MDLKAWNMLTKVNHRHSVAIVIVWIYSLSKETLLKVEMLEPVEKYR